MSAVVGLLRRGLHEVPHLVIGGGIFAFGAALNYYAIYIHVKYDKEKRHWKRRYVVKREEDFDPKDQIHPVDRRYPWY